MNWIRSRARGAVILGLLGLTTAFGGIAPVYAKTATVEEPAAAAPLAPHPAHIRRAQIIGDLLAQYHYRKRSIDDDMSQTVFNAYFDALDRDRYYFLRSDIKRFQRYRTRLDDGFRKGDLNPAFEIFATYQQRVEERVAYALDLLKGDRLDFSSSDTIELDRKDLPWASSTEELNRLWNKRVKHDALTLRMAGQEWDRVKEILAARYERLATRARQHSSDEVFEIYINAWASTFDPHTTYMSPRLSENFDIHMRLSLEGIGALLSSENDVVEIVELITGGPAAKSGQLSPGDQIIGVGQGDDGEIQDVVGWRLADVVDLIRGPKKSVVRLQVLPASGDSVPKMVRLVRNEVKLEEQAAQSKIINVDSGGVSRRIGVITIPTFYMDFVGADAGDKNYRSTTRDVTRLLLEMRKEGIDGLVIDLRGNGGGSLQEATKLTGLFIPDAPVVQVRRSTGEIEVLGEEGSNVVYSGPLAVMVDQYSASASEIFAAAIQDHGRGILVGQQTFGKGTVQTLVDLDNFIFGASEPTGRLKLTIAQFYRVNGGSTQQRGVVPDILFPAAAGPDAFGENSVPHALPWGEIQPVQYQRNEMLTELMPLLRKRHEQRARKDVAFQALEKEYAHLREAQARTTVPLSEKARRAERESLQAERLRLVNKRRKAYGLKPVESLDAKELENTPDTLLRSAAAILADLYTLEPARPIVDARWGKSGR